MYAQVWSLFNHDETYYNLSFVFSDASVQCDSGSLPFPSSSSRVGTSAAANELHSGPTDRDRASASGVPLRRGDATRKSRLVNLLPLLNRMFPFASSLLLFLNRSSFAFENHQLRNNHIFMYLKSLKIKMFFHVWSQIFDDFSQ